MVKHLPFKSLVVLATAFTASMGAWAATPISDAAGLAAIGTDLAGEYELTADITLTEEWTPIGDNDAPFTGIFDGKGHTISGLTCTENGNYVGLFGVVTGTVKNLAIVDVNIYGNEHVGIAAGRVRGGGVIDNIFTSGYINGRDHAGGIVGDAGETSQEATVSNCLSAAYVIARDYQAGGIAGWTKGNVTISNNIFIGEARCNGWAGVGGIIGFVEDGTTTVKNNVNAARKLTGASFIDDGREGGEFNQRYTRGIVGSRYNNNSIVVSTDNLTSDATVIYSIYGDNAGKEPVDQSGMSVDYNGIITPAADLKKAATYTALGFGATWKLNDGNYPIPSFMSMPIKGDYIKLSNIPEEALLSSSFKPEPLSTYDREVKVTVSDNSVATYTDGKITFTKVGNVTVTFSTEGDAFCAGATRILEFAVSDFSPVIATAADMVKFTQNPSANFILAADIDMAGVEFTPISNFSGTLDGQGHWIRNLSFSNTERDRTALFAEFSGEFIKNVGFEGINFVGNADVAAVVGETKADGVISNVVVNNSYLEGRDHVASIVGKLNNGATIINCISNAEIKTRSYQAAGIAGVGIKGTIDKCIFAGTVTAAGGSTNLAGIISLLDDNNVTVKNCLAAAASYTNANVNANGCGLIVNQYEREIALENNYIAAYSTLNGLAVTGSTPDSKQGALATMEEVRSKAWYEGTLGLDFTNDWQFLAGGEGNMLPVLKWMKAPLATIIFNMPSVDGINLLYFEGTENWSYASLLGSWGQSVEVTQLSGEDYAGLVPEDKAIYAGNEEGILPYGGGTATFKVSFDSTVSGLFTLSGRDTFDVNVSLSDDERTINTVEEFLNIRKNPAGKYTLGADIDLTGVEFNGFCNDGSSAFSGILDGAGHSVTNFNLSFTQDSNHGLFGKTSGATIKNIAFTQFSINGAKSVNHVGLIGQGSATLENVAIVGEVTGDDHVGLVAGDADGIEMINCYAVGKVTGGSQVGGYFGCTLEGGCNLENCLSNIDVEATFRGWVGGFIGLIDKGNSAVTIKNCVSIGNCKAAGSGSPKVTAPFIAGNGAGDKALAVITFTGNIYNSAATMEPQTTDWPTKNETAEGGVVEAATAQNPNTLTIQSTYTAIGWDFENTWKMGEGDYKYPVLHSLNVTDFTTSGVEDVIAGGAESNVVIAGVNGEIIVSGLGETAAITVYTVAGVQVASAVVNDAEATVAVPANGFYIVAVATNGTVTTAKVVVK